jgi:hypothetical protein
MRVRRIRLSRFWLLPSFLVVLALLVLLRAVWAEQEAPFEAALAIAGGVIVGIPLGLARGHASRVRLGEEPQTLYLDPSPVLVAIWFAAFVVRFAARSVLPNAHGTSLIVADGFMTLATTSVVASRVIIYRKYLALAKRPTD